MLRNQKEGTVCGARNMGGRIQKGSTGRARSMVKSGDFDLNAIGSRGRAVSRGMVLAVLVFPRSLLLL